MSHGSMLATLQDILYKMVATRCIGFAPLQKISSWRKLTASWFFLIPLVFHTQPDSILERQKSIQLIYMQADEISFSVSTTVLPVQLESKEHQAWNIETELIYNQLTLRWIGLICSTVNLGSLQKCQTKITKVDQETWPKVLRNNWMIEPFHDYLHMIYITGLKKCCALTIYVMLWNWK